MNRNIDDIDRNKKRIYELLRAYIVIAGGIEINDKVLGNMKFEELLDLIVPNGIYLKPFNQDSQ